MGVMKLVLALAVLFLVVLSFAADYKWKQWVKTRQAARERDGSTTKI